MHWNRAIRRQLSIVMTTAQTRGRRIGATCDATSTAATRGEQQAVRYGIAESALGLRVLGFVRTTQAKVPHRPRRGEEPC